MLIVKVVMLRSRLLRQQPTLRIRGLEMQLKWPVPFGMVNQDDYSAANHLNLEERISYPSEDYTA